MWLPRSLCCGHSIHWNDHYSRLIKPIFLLRNSHIEISVHRLCSTHAFKLVYPGCVGLGSLGCLQPRWFHWGFSPQAMHGVRNQLGHPAARAWCGCHIPGNFAQMTKFFPSILFKISGKTTEDMSWKTRWVLALARAEATTKPSAQTLSVSQTSNSCLFHLFL